jgi:hypothetical protein
MHTDLYELYQQQWESWQQRHPMSDEDDRWIADSRDGTQMLLWHHTDGQHVANVIPAGELDFAHRCWATPDAAGLLIEGRFTDEPIPDYVAEALRHALPAPRLFSTYGFQRDGRTVALYTTWSDSDYDNAGDALHTTHYVQASQPDPDLWTDHRFLDLQKWWQGVDSGQITMLDEATNASMQPVVTGKARSEFYDYIATTGPESWTGADEPVLYLYSLAAGATLDDVLALPGTDIRGRFTGKQPAASSR